MISQRPLRRLSEVAEIVPGAAVSVSSDTDSVPVLLPRDVSTATPALDQLHRGNVGPGGRRDRATLRTGDVVVVARGPAPRAALVGPEAAGAVASANLLVVRAGPELAPSVLVAFLMTPEGQRRLCAVQTGATTPAITVAALGRIEVPLPPADVQRALGDFVTAANELIAADERALMLRRELTGRFIERVLGGLPLADFADLELS
jgi:hypothetical protein